MRTQRAVRSSLTALLVGIDLHRGGRTTVEKRGVFVDDSALCRPSRRTGRFGARRTYLYGSSFSPLNSKESIEST